MCQSQSRISVREICERKNGFAALKRLPARKQEVDAQARLRTNPPLALVRRSLVVRHPHFWFTVTDSYASWGMRKIILCSALCVSQAFAIYRPIDVYQPGARGAGAGATGTSNIDSVEILGMNPAYAAEISTPRAALGVDAQTRITRVKSDQVILLKPQFIPMLNFAFPIMPNSGGGISVQSPFQRRFPDGNFIYYTIEGIFAHTLTRNLSAGISLGAGMGLELERFDGWGLSGSASLLYREAKWSAGLFIRPRATLVYSAYPGVDSFSETLPDIVRAAYTRDFSFVELTFGLEYVNWEAVRFNENGVNTAPVIEKGLFGRIHPHIGAMFEIPRWPGLQFRTGFFTQDFIAFDGKNDRQILFTLGLGGLAGEDFWGERLRIDFSLISSFIPSLFWEENNSVEKLQMSFEFMY